jgi:hypothetical protein
LDICLTILKRPCKISKKIRLFGKIAYNLSLTIGIIKRKVKSHICYKIKIRNSRPLLLWRRSNFFFFFKFVIFSHIYLLKPINYHDLEKKLMVIFEKIIWISSSTEFKAQHCVLKYIFSAHEHNVLKVPLNWTNSQEKNIRLDLFFKIIIIDENYFVPRLSLYYISQN